jgi:hypothetical protein
MLVCESWASWLKNQGAEVIALSSNFRLIDSHDKIRFWFSDMDIPRSLH